MAKEQRTNLKIFDFTRNQGQRTSSFLNPDREKQIFPFQSENDYRFLNFQNNSVFHCRQMTGHHIMPFQQGIE